MREACKNQLPAWANVLQTPNESNYHHSFYEFVRIFLFLQHEKAVCPIISDTVCRADRRRIGKPALLRGTNCIGCGIRAGR